MRKRAFALSIFSLLIVAGVALAAVTTQRSKPVPRSILLGNSRVGKNVAHQRAGSVQVFPFSSRAAGTATSIRIYVGSHNHATKLIAGIYAYRNGSPTKRLAFGTLSKPHAHRWNSVSIRHTRIRAGHHYGISVLGRGGRLYFRDRVKRACHGSGSEYMRAVALPRSWHAGNRRSTCSISAYVLGIKRHKRGGGRGSPGSPPGPGAGGGASPPSVVGTTGAPTPSCSTVIQPGNDPTGALAAAAAGSTVCLANGSWPNGITIHQALSKAVTLAAQNPGGAVVNGITFNSSVSGVTFEGFTMHEGFQIIAPASNDSFLHNTMENWGSSGEDAQQDGAFYIYPGDHGSNGPTPGLRIEYNQIDHVPQCLEDNGAGGVTFSHNVCGPGIGFGPANDVHYVQAEGDNNETVDNNAFIGPPANGVVNGGSHLNVYHGCGNNLQFNNNIVWHAQAVAQSLLWGDDCATTNSEANNNLFIEASTPETYSMWIDNAYASSNVTFSNNTIVNPTSYGPLVDQINAFHAHDNLSASATSIGLEGGCDCSSNADSRGGGDVRWTPAWQNTSWTPNSGSPWSAPPAAYYKPAGISGSFGYQGSIGP